MDGSIVKKQSMCSIGHLAKRTVNAEYKGNRKLVDRRSLTPGMHCRLIRNCSRHRNRLKVERQ